MADWQRTPLDRTTLGEVFHLLGTGERSGVKNVYIPLLEGTEAGERLKALNLPEVYGGDVYQALRPEAGKWERTIGGIVLGGLVDPLTYLGGGLTKAGLKAAGSKAARGVSLAEEARRGERALLQLRVPGSQDSLTLVRGTRAYELADKAAQGRLLQSIPRFGQSQVAKVIDDSTSRALQMFNVGAGVDRWFWHKFKGLQSSIMGATSLRAGRYAERLEFQVAELADHLANTYQIPYQEAKTRLGRVINETRELNPNLRLVNDIDGLRAMNLPVPKEYDELNRARRAFEEEFVNPTLGGPATPYDTDVVRRIRQIAAEFSDEYNLIYKDEVANLRNYHALSSHPDQEYNFHLLHPDARSFVRDRASQRFQGGLGGRGGRFPAATHASMQSRSMRWVDNNVLDAHKEGLQDFSVVVRKGTKRKEITLYDALKRYAGSKVPKPLHQRVLQLMKHGPAEQKEFLKDIYGTMLPAMTTKEANAWVWEKGLGDFVPPQTIKQWFEEDPVILLTARGARGDRAVLAKELFGEMVKRAQNDLRTLQTGGKEPVLIVPKEQAKNFEATRNWLTPTTPELKDYVMDPKTSSWFTRMQDAEQNYAKRMTEFAKFYQNATRIWKSHTLALFPVYFIRNLAGNFWNYFVGSDSPKQAMENAVIAVKWMRHDLKKLAERPELTSGDVVHSIREVSDYLGKGTKKIKDINGNDIDLGALYLESARRGAFGIGFLNPDDPSSVREMINRAVRNGSEDPTAYVLRQLRQRGQLRTFSQATEEIGGIVPNFNAAARIKSGLADNKFVETGFRVGQMMEDPIRFAHIIQEVRKGRSVEDAVLSAKGFFFDYHDLSTMERNVLRNVFPFYAWSRKNIPLQVEMLIARPSRVARFYGGVKGFEGADPDDNMLPQYLRENFPLRVRKNKNGQDEYFVFKNWLPLADIDDLLHPVAWSLRSLHPIPKAVSEVALNQSFFTKRELDRMNSVLRGERTTFGKPFKGGVKVPNKLAHVLTSFRPLNAAHQIIDNPQELDFLTHLLRLSVGRVYPLDPDRTMIEFKRKLTELQGDYRRATLSAALRHEAASEQGRLTEGYQRQVQQLMQQYGVK